MEHLWQQVHPHTECTNIYHTTDSQVALASRSVLEVSNISEATNLPRSAVTAHTRTGTGHIDGWLD